MSDNSTYKKYVDSMNELLRNYDEGRQTKQLKFDTCGGKYNHSWVLTCTDSPPNAGRL